MDLLAYLKTMPVAQRDALAVTCGTTLKHLTNVAYGYKPCGAKLAVALERESMGLLKVEDTCPGIDWATVRGVSQAKYLHNGVPI